MVHRNTLSLRMVDVGQSHRTFQRNTREETTMIQDVLRCSQCGGPVKKDAECCEYCGYLFDTKPEPDLDPLPVDPKEIGRFFVGYRMSWQARVREGLIQTLKDIWSGPREEGR